MNAHDQLARRFEAPKVKLEQTGREVWVFDADCMERLQAYLAEQDETIAKLLEEKYYRDLAEFELA